MHSAIDALFQYTRSHVTEQDIVEFSPGDPGYPDYVRVWTEILRTGEVPKKIDLSEVIGLTGGYTPGEEAVSERFRRYRRFTSAVAVVLARYGDPMETIRPAPYLGRDLIIDLDEEDPLHLTLLRPVLPVVHALLAVDPYEREYPFFTFGKMILAQIAEDWPTSERAATRLIEEDAAVRSSPHFSSDDPTLLLGLTNYDQLHNDWRAFAANLKNPTGHEDTQLVIEALSS